LRVQRYKLNLNKQASNHNYLFFFLKSLQSSPFSFNCSFSEQPAQ